MITSNESLIAISHIDPSALTDLRHVDRAGFSASSRWDDPTA
jgi:hypothetical protein